MIKYILNQKNHRTVFLKQLMVTETQLALLNKGERVTDKDDLSQVIELCEFVQDNSFNSYMKAEIFTLRMKFKIKESVALKMDLEDVQSEYTRLILILGSTEGATASGLGKAGDLVAKIQNLSNKINDLNT